MLSAGLVLMPTLAGCSGEIGDSGVTEDNNSENPDSEDGEGAGDGDEGEDDDG